MCQSSPGAFVFVSHAAGSKAATITAICAVPIRVSKKDFHRHCGRVDVLRGAELRLRQTATSSFSHVADDSSAATFAAHFAAPLSAQRMASELALYDLHAMQRQRYSAGTGVPSDHLDTEMMNSVIGCGEY